MRYYQVWPATASYHGQEALTYQSAAALASGQLVRVPYRNKTILGLVGAKTTKPDFAIKDIGEALTDASLPPQIPQLLAWLRDYYPAPLGVMISQFVPRSLLLKKPVELKKAARSSPNNAAKKSLPALTKEQRTAYNNIVKLNAGQSTFLLHGETGSGKTRLYMALAKDAAKQKRSTLILTPEISLTAQLVDSFNANFQHVVVLHSALTDSQRKKIWTEILYATKPMVVIGPRSALFAPLKDIGLIVVDEAHETAYKQEQAPYYYALRVAGRLAALHKAKLVFGTATPTVSEYYIAEQKKVPILRLAEQAITGQAASPELKVIDLKDKSLFNRHPYISDQLLNAITTALAKNEQVLVFLNRRGTARVIVCQNCGWQSLCPNCDLPLTYHGDQHLVRCHTCGFKQAPPHSCPVCHSTDIIFKSFGTKAIAEALQKLLPTTANIGRFDTDNRHDERLEVHYQDIASGKINVLVGTQLLAKGLDLPKLALVGVIAADNSLYFPDYTAEERTYQLLSQVIGRVGRGHRHGTAIIQTYNPASPTLTAALNRDWPMFYQQQLAERQMFGFPPFYHLLKLTCRRKTQKGAAQAADNLARQLKGQQANGLKIEIAGPSPSFYEKAQGAYQWQIIVKAKDRSQLLQVVEKLPSGWTYNLDPLNLL